MALYYPQVKALVQGTRGVIPATNNNWDIFPSTVYNSSASSPYGSHPDLVLYSNVQPVVYHSDGIRLGGPSSNGHCGFVTQGSNAVVDLTKDFRFYFVCRKWGSGTDRDSVQVAFITGALGSSITTSGYPVAPIPKHNDNFGVTVGGWYMRDFYNTHWFYRRTSSTQTSFPSAYGYTNQVTGTNFSFQKSGTYAHYWNIHEWRYDATNQIFEYHQHRQGLNSSTDFLGTSSQGNPISDYYTTNSRFYNFTFGNQSGWETPSSMDLTNCHISIKYVNGSTGGNTHIFPRIGVVQS